MGKWKTQNDPDRPAYGEHYQVEQREYPYGARRRGSGQALTPQTRSVDSMKAPIPRSAAQTNAEKAMITDESEGAPGYLKLAQGADSEGRHEDAEVFREHAIDEIRHENEDRDILENPDEPDYWMAGAFNPAHRGRLHKELGIPQGQKIGRTHLTEIVNTPTGEKWHGHTVTPLMKHRAQAALNANPPGETHVHVAVPKDMHLSVERKETNPVEFSIGREGVSVGYTRKKKEELPSSASGASSVSEFRKKALWSSRARGAPSEEE